MSSPDALPSAVASADNGPVLTATGRRLILATAFLGWLFAGTLMAITPLMSRSAVKEMLPDASEALIGRWFAWYNSAFLFGAAAGGLIFGWIGDRAGRTKGMGLSVLCFTALSGLSYFVRTPEQLLILRFLACLGVGGMWPNGIAIVSEAWHGASRPLLAGLIGTAANVGIVMVGVTAIYVKITPDNWRWLMLAAAAPIVLGAFILAAVPESPKWLAGATARQTAPPPVAEVFSPPLLMVTIIGIFLGTIPLLGGWGSGNWLVPWADRVGGTLDPHLKAWTLVARSTGGAISSLLGGWVAGTLGRKRSYFLISLGSLLCSAYLFRWLQPSTQGQFGPWDFLSGLVGAGETVDLAAVNWFSFWAFMLGIISGLYFGWLPLCLPELFPTRVRSTGSGISFNFGRIAAACGVLGAGELIRQFDGDYGRVGAVTSLIYAVGMVVIWFAPDRTGTELEE